MALQTEGRDGFMAGKLQRPILVGGIGLSVALALWEGLDRSTGDIGEWGILGAIAVGAGAWLLRPRVPELDLSPMPAVCDRAIVEKEFAKTQATIDRFAEQMKELDASESEVNASIAPFTEDLDRLKTSLERTAIDIAIVGGKSTGKTSLLAALESARSAKNSELELNFDEIPALFTSEEPTEETTAFPSELTADIVVFLVSGDITEPEFGAVESLRAAGYKTILVSNKQDRYPSDEQAAILQQLQQRMQGLVDPEDIASVAASPAPLKVRQHQPDASVEERLETQPPQINTLAQRLESVAQDEREPLVFATTVRHAKSLRARVKQELDRLRRDRAMPIIAQYQWIAGAAALANPVPALDLLATGAVSGQLVMDLGEIYQQKFSLEQAKVTATNLGSIMVKLGLVELSTQTISAMLKTNAVTYLAGGAVQGVSAAYLTRIVGLSLIEYFQQQEVVPTVEKNQGLNLDALAEIVKRVFAENQRTAFVRSFATQALDRLSPKLKPESNSSNNLAANH
ncbi:MAG: DUF697 domain-containing protein [Cyanobacteriota bacterium]|nr:DUF697 domain-containing protein [Cyanobacteriota bacterium]